MSRIFFFATPSDIKPVLKRFESHDPIKFVEDGAKPTFERAIYLESRDLPAPGIAIDEAGDLSKRYLVSFRDTKNALESVTTVTGQRQWWLHNGDNPEAVWLNLRGLWSTGTLVPGEMNRMYETPAARRLMPWFLAALKQEEFVKVDIFWLGREAMSRFKEGRRLTKVGEDSPPAFDLKWR